MALLKIRLLHTLENNFGWASVSTCGSRARAGHVTSRGGKCGLSNKPIFPQPLCLPQQHNCGQEPEAHASGACLLQTRSRGIGRRCGQKHFCRFYGCHERVPSPSKAQQFEACWEKGSEGDHELENGLVSGLIRMGAAQTSSVIYRLHSSHRKEVPNT